VENLFSGPRSNIRLSRRGRRRKLKEEGEEEEEEK
jgi:hypothetical protein